MKMETVLYKALVASNVPEVHATAVIEAMEKEMTSTLASKTDLSTVRTELKADIATLRAELKIDISELQKSLVKLDAKVDILSKNLTIRLLLIIGATAGVSSGLVTSGLKYLA
ncbi:hypothetical protein [Pseudomonas sp. MWU12-2323]|uniref:hypothetical protein n=1 Tax=Pseudomonas sp. MWU12-2323 TaxID=2651296 RepID=UPI00128D4820|nr:hypothetical protein [Pseudomonas sp. MWU12-2323]MPQ71772.1 hypothetical protein [Pseudomonas sp. MWU12-2323]